MADFTLKPASADSYINSVLSTTNYGSATELLIGYYAGNGSINRLQCKFDMSSIPSAAECKTATLGLWLNTDYAGADCTWQVFILKRNWVEAQVTYAIYSTGNAWGTAGGMGADDIYADAIGTSGTITNGTAANTKISITLDIAEIEKMYNGTYSNYGFLIKATNEAEDNTWSIYSKEHATTAYRPELFITTKDMNGNQIVMLSDYGII